MANEKTLNTRLVLKHDSLAAWLSSKYNKAPADGGEYLKNGEVAIITLGANEHKDGATNGDNGKPVLFKVGTGAHKFEDLPFASALAADVHAWAKQSEADFKEWHPDTDTTYSFEIKYGVLQVTETPHKNGVAQTPVVSSYDFITPAEVQAIIEDLDSEASQEAGDDGLALNITITDGKVTAFGGSIKANTYDAYGAATEALEDAKAYVDDEDIFHTDITTVNALGGIAAGANLDGMTTHEILNTLLFPYVAFVINSSSRSAAAATLENGATQNLNSATISVTKKSKPITSIKLFNGSTVLGEKTGDEVAAGGTITFSNLGITVSKDNNPNLKFTVTDGTTSTDKNVGASTFVYPYYMGECAADASIDETLIESLTKKVESKGNKTVTHTVENGRMVIAYPKAHGVLKSILDPNNFETIGDYTRSEVPVTGLDGSTQTYYVYASGAATVSGFKVQYKY